MHACVLYAYLVMCMCAGACLPPCILGLGRVLGTRLRQAHVHPLILAVEVLELRAVGEWRPACVRRRDLREHTVSQDEARWMARRSGVCTAPRHVHACRQSTKAAALSTRWRDRRAAASSRAIRFASARHHARSDRGLCIVENKPDTCGAIHAQSQCGQRLIDRGIYVVQLEAWSVALCGVVPVLGAIWAVPWRALCSQHRRRLLLREAAPGASTWRDGMLDTVLRRRRRGRSGPFDRCVGEAPRRAKAHRAGGVAIARVVFPGLLVYVLIVLRATATVDGPEYGGPRLRIRPGSDPPKALLELEQLH